MGKGPNVADSERRLIRALYRCGIKVAEIMRITGRSESTVLRTVRDLSRPRPSPPRRFAKRDARIAELVLIDGLPQVRVASRYHLTPTRVCQIVKRARAMRKRPRRN